jgi:orotate phosphoribosyltransferase/uridine monophosphate synthetase
VTTPQDAGSDGPQGRLWLAETLWKLGSVQFGNFTLGRTVRGSPVYVNAKLLISRPQALLGTARLIETELRMALAMRNQAVEPFDAIAGVPIGGLHVATALSLQMQIPLLYVRPPREPVEVSAPQIEGIYRPGQTALIVDDLAAGGGSLVETAEALRHAGIRVRDAFVLVDREQGAGRRLEAIGVRLHCMLSLEVMLTYLHSNRRIQPEDYDRAMAYIHRESEPRSEYD